MNNGIELLGAMKLAPNFSTGSTPSNSMIAFIERIENADPNSDNTDEDDMDISWGHRQFMAGSMTCVTTLTSWASIGDVATACRLIATAIKTCHVARHICFAKKVETSSYLSDAYLENTLDLLWVHWKTAGVPVPKAKEVVRKQSQQPNGPGPTDGNGDARGTLKFQMLTKDELIGWMKEHHISAPKGAKKGDLVCAIESADAAQQLCKEDLVDIIQKRKGRKKSAGKPGAAKV
ncbi:hypothetical protein B0H21DRAFT_827560 [Amylocystis lapponica]|nr:hypothetical protein B0H21DRAFT_827560 [Amylocystis lapponica]